MRSERCPRIFRWSTADTKGNVGHSCKIVNYDFDSKEARVTHLARKNDILCAACPLKTSSLFIFLVYYSAYLHFSRCRSRGIVMKRLPLALALFLAFSPLTAHALSLEEGLKIVVETGRDVQSPGLMRTWPGHRCLLRDRPGSPRSIFTDVRRGSGTSPPPNSRSLYPALRRPPRSIRIADPVSYLRGKSHSTPL